MKSRSQIAIEALDETAGAMERKWGVGRLPRLVPVDLAEKFYRQVEKLNAEIVEEATAGFANVEREAGRMRNAWMALDAAAEAAGAEKLEAAWFEGRLPDGRLLIVCPHLEAAQRIAGDNRAAVIWTMEELGNVLWAFEMVNDAKTVWPGAKVEQVRVDPESTLPKVDWSKGDELPDALKAWSAG